MQRSLLGLARPWAVNGRQAHYHYRPHCLIILSPDGSRIHEPQVGSQLLPLLHYLCCLVPFEPWVGIGFNIRVKRLYLPTRWNALSFSYDSYRIYEHKVVFNYFRCFTILCWWAVQFEPWVGFNYLIIPCWVIECWLLQKSVNPSLFSTSDGTRFCSCTVLCSYTVPKSMDDFIVNNEM
jgi:hypothetical protein